ncbi:MAG TPA: ImmA/IrrE family metallo-endopeptidase [Fimbriimonas sp.]|nr:ImmA/IrrE family metallo-endopeptidase [Fimbriimonas sp.]
MIAEEEARRLRQLYSLSTPVDVKATAERLGIAVMMNQLEADVSGMLILHGGRAFIAVNQGHHRTRQRFSIAHEIGHYVLHRGKSDLFVDGSYSMHRDSQSSTGEVIWEIQANAFAAELLVPELELRSIVGARQIDPFDETTIRRIAAHFDVSPYALSVRLGALGLSGHPTLL